MNAKRTDSIQRSGIRRALLLGAALLFPVTMLYFSPGIVFRGARLGILSGSYYKFRAIIPEFDRPRQSLVRLPLSRRRLWRNGLRG